MLVKKVKMARVLSALLVLLLALTALAGCTSGTATVAAAKETTAAQTTAAAETTAVAAAGKTIKIGLSFGTLEQERWQKEKTNMEAYAKELGGIELISQSANNDATKQNTQAENLIAQGIDVLLVVPQDGAAAAQIVKTAHDAKVPVIAYDRMITLTIYRRSDSKSHDIKVYLKEYNE